VRIAMSAESTTRIKGERDALDELVKHRPRTRVAIGIFVALLYFGILAFAGIFISGAVNSLTDRGAVAHATIQRLTGATGDSANETAQIPLPESPRAAPAPKPAPAVAAAPSPPPSAPAVAAVPAPPPTAAAVVAAPAPPAVSVTALPPVAAPPRVPSVTAALPPPAPSAPPQPRVIAAVPPPAPPGGARPSAAALNALAPASAPARGDAGDQQALLDAGDARLADGDIASARLYYERAAEAGNARAARVLGNSYDPIFLVRWGVRGMNSDNEEAARWYQLAGALGDGEAKQDLAALSHH
jgi:hypothetical protein